MRPLFHVIQIVGISSPDHTRLIFILHPLPEHIGLNNFTFGMGSPLPVSLGQSPEVSSLILISQTAPGRIRLWIVCSVW